MIYGSPKYTGCSQRKVVFKGSIAEGLIQVKKAWFHSRTSVYRQSPTEEGLSQVLKTKSYFSKDIMDDDFERSSKVNCWLFDNGGIKIDIECKLTKADIDNQKYDKNKRDEAGKFRTKKKTRICLVSEVGNESIMVEF